MLKTAEIPMPQVTHTQTFNGRHVLYDTFNAIVLLGSVKDYPRWRGERNKRWVGGFTAEGNVDSVSDVPLAVILRESKGMVQLVVANMSAQELDGARYKKYGWEFRPDDPRILMDVRQYKWGRQNKIIAKCRFPDSPIAYKEPLPELEGMERFAHEMIFAELVDIIKGVSPKGYPTKQLLTSPVWRDYNLADNKISRSGGYRSEWSPWVR